MSMAQTFAGCDRCAWLLVEGEHAPWAAGSALVRHLRDDHGLSPQEAALLVVRAAVEHVERLVQAPPLPSGGTPVLIQFTIADHNPQRAQDTVDRHLRPLIEEALQGAFGRYVIGAPVIRVVRKTEQP